MISPTSSKQVQTSKTSLYQVRSLLQQKAYGPIWSRLPCCTRTYSSLCSSTTILLLQHIYFLQWEQSIAFEKKKEKKAWQTSRNLLLLVCYAFYGPFLNAAKPQPLALSDCFREPGQISYLGAIFVLNTVFNLFWNKARNPLKLKTMNYFSPF